MTTQIDTTNQRIDKLNQNLEKQLSFKRNFLMSILNGIGYAIGASLIAGVILTVLTWTIDSIQDVPVIGKFVSNGELNFLTKTND